MPDVNELLNRVVAVAIEGMAALDPPVNADGKPYFYHAQETFPYFAVRVNNNATAPESEDYDMDTLTVLLYLVVGYTGNASKGAPEQKLYTYMPHLKQQFNKNEFLQTAAGTYTAAMTDLVDARCTAWSVNMALERQGINTSGVIVGELTLTCRFLSDLLDNC